MGIMNILNGNCVKYQHYSKSCMYVYLTKYLIFQIPLVNSLTMIEVITNIFGSSLGKIFLIDIGIQWVGWAFAVAFKTEKFYDLTGNFFIIC